MLKITKKGYKYWLFEDSEIGLFSPSKFTINLLNNVITIVYENGLKSKNYNVIDCEIYDLGATSPFTTSSGNAFMEELENLNCPCFQKNENIYNISGGTWSELTDFDSLPDADLPLLGTEQIAIIQDGETKKLDLSTKVDKVSTAGVERAYIVNADGSQGTKATSDFKDVLEFANLASFPATGESSKIYLALDTNLQYRWSGSAYVQIGGNPKKSIEYNVTSLCIYNFPATSNWTYQNGFFGMGAYGSARGDSGNSNFLTLIASYGFTKVIGGIAPYNMKLTSNSSFVTPDSNLIGGDLKLSVGYVEFNYATGALSNATLVDSGTYTPVTSGRVDLREDFGGEITIPKGAIWCYSWAHTKTSAVSSVYLQTILNFEEV